MTLTQVEEVVQKKAIEEAEGVLNAERAAAEAHWERESARCREEHQRRLAAMEATLQAGLDREVGTRDTEHRLRLLAGKNEIIEEVFRKAVEGVLALPDNGYSAWLKTQLAALPKGVQLAIVPNDRDRAKVAQFLKEAGRSDLRLSEGTAPIAGGFLAVGTNADLDYSVEALMNAVRESISEEVAKRLFEE